MKRKFAISHAIITLAEILGWIVTLMGSVVLIQALMRGGGGGQLAFMSLFAALGLALVTLVQLARAQIATAENTGEMVALMRAQAERAAPGPDQPQ